MASYSVVSDREDTHKVPASRVERAGGGDGCEDMIPFCVIDVLGRVPSGTGGTELGRAATHEPRSFSVHHFFAFRIVFLLEMEAALTPLAGPLPHWSQRRSDATNAFLAGLAFPDRRVRVGRDLADGVTGKGSWLSSGQRMSAP